MLLILIGALARSKGTSTSVTLVFSVKKCATGSGPVKGCFRASPDIVIKAWPAEHIIVRQGLSFLAPFMGLGGNFGDSCMMSFVLESDQVLIGLDLEAVQADTERSARAKNRET